MHSTDYEMLVVSDGVDSIELCEDCAENRKFQNFDKTPIFADTEMDRNPTCDQCGYTSFVFNPTSECIDNWIDDLREFVTGDDQRRNQSNTEFLDEVAERIPFVNATPGEELIAELYQEVRKG